MRVDAKPREGCVVVYFPKASVANIQRKRQAKRGFQPREITRNVGEEQRASASIRTALVSGDYGEETTAALARRLSENDCDTACACGVPGAAKCSVFLAINCT